MNTFVATLPVLLIIVVLDDDLASLFEFDCPIHDFFSGMQVVRNGRYSIVDSSHYFHEIWFTVAKTL
jgi:hypothetical protein